MHLQWCVKLHLILLQFSYNIRHHFNGDGKLSCLLPIRFKTDLPTKFKTIVVLCLSCNSCNSQLPTSSKNLVASAQFLVTLATSASHFQALNRLFILNFYMSWKSWTSSFNLPNFTYQSNGDKYHHKNSSKNCHGRYIPKTYCGHGYLSINTNQRKSIVVTTRL